MDRDDLTKRKIVRQGRATLSRRVYPNWTSDGDAIGELAARSLVHQPAIAHLGDGIPLARHQSERFCPSSAPPHGRAGATDFSLRRGIA